MWNFKCNMLRLFLGICEQILDTGRSTLSNGRLDVFPNCNHQIKYMLRNIASKHGYLNLT